MKLAKLGALCGEGCESDQVEEAEALTGANVSGRIVIYEYEDVIHHSEDRWLSHRRILERLFELREEIGRTCKERHSPILAMSNGTLVNFRYVG